MFKAITKRMKALSCIMALGLLVAGYAIAPQSALAADFVPDTLDVKIGGGQQGGSWYVYGGRIAEILNKQFPGMRAAVTLGGGATNVVSVNGGEYTLALNHGVSNWLAWNGNKNFFRGTKYQKIRHVISFWAASSHFMAPRSLGIEWVDQIDDAPRKLTFQGLTGSGSYFSEQSMLACGFGSPDLQAKGHQISYSPHTIGAQNMQDGLCDVLHINDPPRTGVALELDKVIPGGIVELKLRPEQLKKVIDNNRGFVEIEFPGGIYSGNPDSFKQLGSMNTVICNEDLSDEFVYRITKAIVENMDMMNQVFPPELQVKVGPQIVDGIAVPMHPGARKYFEEIGLGQYIKEPAMDSSVSGL